MQWLADLAQHYKGGQIHCADIRGLEDRVLALGTLRFTGMGSGIEIEVPVAIVASFRDGLMTHFKDHGDKDKAFEAVCYASRALPPTRASNQPRMELAGGGGSWRYLAGEATNQAMELVGLEPVTFALPMATPLPGRAEAGLPPGSGGRRACRGG